MASSEMKKPPGRTVTLGVTLLGDSRFQEGRRDEMSSNRRKFTDEFKADAVQFVVQGERSIAQVAREFEINESSLGYWVKTYRAQHPAPATTPLPAEAARVAKLEAEVRRLAEANAFLKKAAAFFAREQR